MHPDENHGHDRAFSLWQELRDSIKGTDADYTKISLKRAILLLAVPMVLELVMESTFAVVDIFFVSSLGPSAVATVGLTETYLFLLYSVAMGLSMAVTAIVARRIGEKSEEGAGLVTVQSVVLGALVSVPFSAAGLFFAKDLLGLMGADAWAMEHGYRYTQWMLGGNVVIVLLFVINAVFRGAGDAAIAMRVLWISNAVNMALVSVLVTGKGPFPALGVEGAAIATNIGRGIGVLAQLYYLFKGSPKLHLLASRLRLDAGILLEVFKTALGGIGQMFVGMTSWIFLMRILSNVGSEAVAGATIALRIMMFTLMPAWGLSNAAATLVGQNLGAKNPDRAESSVWKIGIYNTYFLGVVSLVYFFFNESLMGIFTADPEVIAIGSSWLRILSYSFLVYGWWMVSTQAFNGSGDTRTPTYINLVFFWMIQIPLSYFLALRLGWQHTGVFWGVFFSETSAGLFTLWLFSRGGWKQTKV
ncbi:MAG TPA: MATE family efflux transporter [Fibrobacteria bacterium]|nr:MATE family efflux transporter [Fibrobacteria bacterium]